MKLRSRLKALAMRFTRSGAGSAFRFGWGRRDLSWSVGNGANSSVVMAPLQWLMRSFPEAPPVVDRRKGNEWVEEEDHDLVTLLARPNEFYSGDLLWRATVAELALTGNGYWVKVTDRQLRVLELWWVPSSLIEPKWESGSDEFIGWYEYAPGGEKVRLDPSEVVHFRWDIDPENDRKGLSPLASVLREVFADDEAGRFAAALLKNMGVPGLIISPDGDHAIPDDDLEATKTSITQRFSGEGVGSPLVFGDSTKVQQFGFSPEQMDMRTLRRVPEERVSAVLGVPAIVAGLGAGLDRSTFANYAEAREAGTENCIIPLQRLIAAEVTHQLLPDFEADAKSVRLRFDISQVRALQEDENAIVERRLKELSAGAITLAEYRVESGRDAGPEHEVFLRNMSVVEVRVEDLGLPPPDPAEFGLPAPGEQLQIEPPREEEPEPKRKRRAKTGTPLQRRLNAEYNRSLEHLADSVSPRIGLVFDALARDAADAFLMIAPKSRKIDDGGLRELAAQILAAVVVEKHAEKLKQVVRQHYGVVADHTVSTLNSVFDLQVNLPDHEARRIIELGGTRAGLVDMSGDTREAIFRGLLDGRVLGEGQDALARRIRSEVADGPFPHAGSSYRSKLIARTETKFAQNVSAMSAYTAAGATQVLAFDAQSGNTDAECEARNGKTFSFDEAEAELAGTHPNCTLSFAPVFE